jgi:Cof subfamily protein (haloacid dehalogenase superfamily)
MKYRLLVLDLDGTLTNSRKEITPHTRDVLLQAQERGVRLVLASGRPTYGIAPLADELRMNEFGGYILAYNGGTIIDWRTGEVLHASELTADLVAPAYEMARRHGVEILSYVDRHIITETPDNRYVQYESMLTRMPVRGVDNFCLAAGATVPKCLVVGDEQLLLPLESQMKQRFGEAMSIYRSEAFYLELNPPAIDKANSLRLLLDRLGLTADCMMACGDGFNDLTMIRLAGLGVAMGNAKEEVKAAARFVTLTNEEDGVAHAVERFLL